MKSTRTDPEKSDIDRGKDPNDNDRKTNSDTVIDISGLDKSYSLPAGPLRVLRNLDLKVNRGERISIMGPSGSGKSTLLHIIGLLDTFDKGTYKLVGIDVKDLSPRDKRLIRLNKIGFIFQTFNLLQTLTVRQNIELPLALQKVPGEQQKRRAERIMESLGISDKAELYPHQLSIGEQQRVAIARALIIEPAIILADEPSGNLDRENTEKLLDFIDDTLKKYEATLIVVTHNPIIKRICSTSYKLENGRLIPDQ